jgi:hypothetical protein
MRKTILLFAAIALSYSIYATDARLIVQKVDNGGVVSRNTFRIYAEMPSEQHSLHIVYGTETSPMVIESTAPFYQNQYGGHSAAAVSENVFASEPTMKFDSWITLGYENNVSNDMWDLGVDFSSFDTGGNILATNGGWFLIPTDEKCQAGNKKLILIAQFTTTGIASGTLNLQGWNGSNNVWRSEGLTFSTTNAETFGCNDQKAVNYSADATFNDGSCAYSQNDLDTAGKPSSLLPANSWEIFPNPLRQNLINVQFNSIKIKGDVRLDIYDMSGKLVGSHKINNENMIGSNRVVVQQELASGTYNVMLVQDDTSESKLLIVEK